MKKRLFVITGLVLLFSTSLFAAGVSLTGVGARGTALSGAYRGVSDDWSAMFWNPAGMTQISGLHAGFSGEVLIPVANFLADKWNGQNFSVLNETETENEPKTFFIPAAGIVYGISEKLSVGLGVWAPFGLGAKWDLLNTQKYNSIYPEFDYEDDLMILDIHPTVAYKLNDMISVGAGLSILYADIIIRKPGFIPNPYLVNPDLSLFQASLGPAGALNPEYNHLIVESELSGTGLGFGANIGIMFKLSEKLQIGVSGRYYADTPLDGKVNGTAYFADHATGNQVTNSPLAVAQFQSKLAAGEITESEYGVLTSMYSGAKSVVYEDADADATIPLPMDVGLGIAYWPIKEGNRHLLISADVMLTQWSTWDIIDIDIEGGDKSQLVEKWEDSFRANLGIEYRFNSLLALRGGYYFEQKAAINETLTPVIPDMGDRNAINIGLEFKLLPGLALHASYEKIMISDNTVEDWLFNMESTEYENMAGDYKMKVNNFMFGLGYNF